MSLDKLEPASSLSSDLSLILDDSKHAVLNDTNDLLVQNKSTLEALSNRANVLDANSDMNVLAPNDFKVAQRQVSMSSGKK